MLLPALTFTLAAVRDGVGLAGALLLYLLAVVVIALVGGLWPALAAAVAAGLLADYYLVSPRHSLDIARGDEILVLAVFVAVAALVGTATGTAARRSYRAGRALSEARVLSRLATDMMHGQELPALVERIRENFALTAVSLLVRETASAGETRWFVAAGAGDRPPERPDEAEVEAALDDGLTLAGRGRGLNADDYELFAACGAQIGMAWTRGRLARRAAETDTHAAAERTRASLLLRAGRELRAVLHGADDALARLRRDGSPSVQERDRLLDYARSSVRRAGRLVGALDVLSKLQGGALALALRPVELSEVLMAALDDLGPGGHTLRLLVPDDPPDVIADAAHLTRALTAVAADALRHSPPDEPPSLTAKSLPGRLAIRVTDGAGAPGASEGAGARAEGIAQQLARELVEAMGGTLTPAGAPGEAFSVQLLLPTVAGKPEP